MSGAIATPFAVEHPLKQQAARAHDRQRWPCQLLCRFQRIEASRACDGVLSGGRGVAGAMTCELAGHWAPLACEMGAWVDCQVFMLLTPVPRGQVLVQVMFVLFSVGTAMWAVTVARSWAVAHRLHILMGVLAGFKALTLLSQAGELHLVKTTGHTGNWNIAFYIFTFLRGILFFTARAGLLLWCLPLATLRAECMCFMVSPIDSFHNAGGCSHWHGVELHEAAAQ